jgi:lysyl-tRNA synthetase class 2
MDFQEKKEAFGLKVPTLGARAHILRAMKDFFASEEFIEVDTPILQRSAGMEVHLSTFKTVFKPDTELGLATSPEFAMKKLLALGVPKLYQFAHVFRNELVTPTHYPEFTMLEWYRTGEDYTKLMADCDELLARSLDAAGNAEFAWNGKTCKAVPAERMTVAEAIKRYAGVDMFKENLSGDKFYKVMLDVEPKLGVGTPTILYEYPISEAVLSRPSPSDPRVAERFELYVCGMELANAFSELTDVKVQRARFEHDMKEKKKLYGEAEPIDEEFLEAVAHLPDCAGIALGFERLVMLSTGATDIKDTMWSLIPEI